MVDTAIADLSTPIQWGEAVSSFQRLLNANYGCKLTVDGDLGANTRKAVQRLSTVELCIIDLQLTKEFNMGVKSLYVQERGYGMPDTIDISEAKAQLTINKLCKMLNMSGHEGDFLGFLRLEAYPAETAEGPGFNNLSHRPGAKYRGLGQFDKTSWESARLHILREINIDIDIGDYRDNVYKPAHSIAAIIGYANYNKGKMLDWNIPINAETLYMSHNQGVYWWRKRGLPIAGDQSSKASYIASKYRNLIA